jgi:hypothetical protein
MAGVLFYNNWYDGLKYRTKKAIGCEISAIL